MTAIRCPALIASPSLTPIEVTVPPLSASTGISIFIDSRITRVSPSCTSSPSATTTCCTTDTSSESTSSAMTPHPLVRPYPLKLQPTTHETMAFNQKGDYLWV